MATTFAYKVLGQAYPANTAETTLYTVPSSTQAITSTLIVCNQSASAVTFSVAVKPAGAAIASKHYIYYTVTIQGNDTMDLTTAITLATTDVVSVICGTGSTLSFNLFGTEYS